jgi:hypothetical protein
LGRLKLYTNTFLVSYTDYGGVSVSLLALSVVDRGFEPRLGQTKDSKIGICCFSDKHAVLRRKGKDWLAKHQDEVSEWSGMSSADWCFSELAQ